MTKKLFYLFLLLFTSKPLIAQTKIQNEFFDKCYQAINFYKDFLIEQNKGEDSFEKGKKLFSDCYNQLFALKSLKQIDDSNYSRLKMELESMKSLDFKTFTSKMQQQKEKRSILIKGSIVSLPVAGAGLLVYLQFISTSLHNFQNWAVINNSKILNVLAKGLNIGSIYFLKSDSLIRNLNAHNIPFEIEKLKQSWDQQYDEIITIRNPKTVTILNKYKPDSISLLIDKNKLGKCIWYFSMPELLKEEFNNDLTSFIYNDGRETYNWRDSAIHLYLQEKEDLEDADKISFKLIFQMLIMD